MHYAHLILGLMVILTLLLSSTRQKTFARSFSDWLIDFSSLLVHFFVIPISAFTIGSFLREELSPGYQGMLDLPGPVVFCGSLFIVDYLWYWNHRLFHAETWFWNLHEVHHNARVFDVLMSPRNTFWSPFFMVYIWFGIFAAFVLRDLSWFVAASAFSLVINFWGHSSFGPKSGSFLHRLISSIFITPHEHGWHHSSDSNNHNFATVFSFWDKIHGTYYSPAEPPASYGFKSKFSTFKQIFFPFKLFGKH